MNISQKTYYVCITNTKSLMIFMEIINTDSDNHTVHCVDKV